MPGWPAQLADGPVGLRPLRLRDAGRLRTVRTRNAEWLRPWEPTHPDPPPQLNHVAPYLAMARSIRREARRGVAMPWAITYEGEFAGQLTVGALMWGSARSGQVGYWIDQRLAGRGCTPRAVALAVDHCFFTVGLHRIEANIRPENRASRRVAEKLGFIEEGVRRGFLHIDGAWRDHVCYAITVEDVPQGVLARLRHGARDDGPHDQQELYSD
ncbi:GNAT family protein [Lipingzhangella sp. LS1_29]|uniref:GNAT family protein n=1 Tax=Lipingzhangella rawalii TaxID=2055835 RepID=A0ABU2H4X0_9ACTN|nr:GNAT family protein [Lipingzhangella rawalii]MDS1270352.1 GNAT family protein [Lipingzhangella rawalii]